jgi:predicted nucleotide-binding protein
VARRTRHAGVDERQCLTARRARSLALAAEFGVAGLSDPRLRHRSTIPSAMKKTKGPPERPRVFVGSSVENLDTAYAIQENLDHRADVTVWHQGLFELSATTIEGLVRALGKFDFAIFVFAPDDTVRIRRTKYNSVRDNVLFELGLFVGRLGRERTFIFLPRDTPDLRLPTDLLGVTPATYRAQRADGNLLAALGPACNAAFRSFTRLGVIKPHTDRRRRSHSATKAPVPGPPTPPDLPLLIQERFAFMAVLQHSLSVEARALIQSIARQHLTAFQYRLLASGRLGPAVQELVSAGVLTAVVGIEQDRESVVHYFPPHLSTVLQAARHILPPPSSAIRKRVSAELARVGYVQSGASKEGPEPSSRTRFARR